MLDPIKVSIVTPGMTENGLDKKGIPATLVTAYLHRRGVEVEKTTDFTILLLFSIGITKGKWGTLLNALLDFKRDYDQNSPLTDSRIADLLGDQGIVVARRTVAKYREALQIPPVNLRKAI